MQYTAIHETIDGFEIVKGLSTAAPRPCHYRLEGRGPRRRYR